METFLEISEPCQLIKIKVPDGFHIQWKETKGTDYFEIIVIEAKEDNSESEPW